MCAKWLFPVCHGFDGYCQTSLLKPNNLMLEVRHVFLLRLFDSRYHCSIL